MIKDNQLENITIDKYLPNTQQNEANEVSDSSNMKIISNKENKKLIEKISQQEQQIKQNQTIKESKQMAIIKQFHKIYQMLSEKCFVAQSEVEYQNTIEYYQKLLNIELVIFLTSLLSIVNSVVYYELTYDKGVENQSKKHYVSFLYHVHILSALFFTALVIKEYINIQYDISSKKSIKNETIFHSNRYRKLIAYVVIFISHPSPLFFNINFTERNEEYNTVINYSVNSMLTVMILLRFFFVIRPLFYLSAYMDPQTAYACKQYNFEPNLYFSLKCQAQSSSLLIYSFGLLISLFALSFAVRIFERPASDTFDNFLNALWLIIITMMTVGYGDITAKTIGGRVISIISCICGVFLISMVIVTITSRLNLDQHEYLMFIIFNKTQKLENEKSKAKTVIKKYLNIVMHSPNRHNYSKIFEKNQTIKEMKEIIKEFNETVGQNINSNTQDFISFHNRISFLIDLQNKLIQRRNGIYANSELLKQRIQQMKNKGFL